MGRQQAAMCHRSCRGHTCSHHTLLSPSHSIVKCRLVNVNLECQLASNVNLSLVPDLSLTFLLVGSAGTFSGQAREAVANRLCKS